MNATTAIIENRISLIKEEQRTLLMQINRIDRQPFFGGKLDEMERKRERYIYLNTRKQELELVLCEIKKQEPVILTLVS